MEIAGIIFSLIWLTLFFIGIVSAVKKARNKAQSAPGQQGGSKYAPTGRTITNRPWQNSPASQMHRQMDEASKKLEAERRAMEARFKSTSTSANEATYKVAAEGSLENPADISAKPAQTGAKADAAAAKEPAPGRKMDFDAEDMVIYSEIMKPGYEKY